MKKTSFRNLVVPFFILIFLSHIYAQRWVPEDDYNHIKTFNNVLEKMNGGMDIHQDLGTD